MDRIKITKNVGTPIEENQELETNGYLLLYIEDGNVKTSGELSLKVFAPIIPAILKFFTDKMGKES